MTTTLTTPHNGITHVLEQRLYGPREAIASASYVRQFRASLSPHKAYPTGTGIFRIKAHVLSGLGGWVRVDFLSGSGWVELALYDLSSVSDYCFRWNGRTDANDVDYDRLSDAADAVWAMCADFAVMVLQ